MHRRTFLIAGGAAAFSTAVPAAPQDPAERLRAQFEFDATRLLRAFQARLGEAGPVDLVPTTRAIAAIGSFSQLLEVTQGDIAAPGWQALVRELATAVGAGLLAVEPRLAELDAAKLSPPGDEDWLPEALEELEQTLGVDSSPRARRQVREVLAKLRAQLRGPSAPQRLARAQRKVRSLSSLAHGVAASGTPSGVLVLDSYSETEQSDDPEDLEAYSRETEDVNRVLGYIVLGVGVTTGTVLVVLGLVNLLECPCQAFVFILLGVGIIAGSVVLSRRLRGLQGKNSEPLVDQPDEPLDLPDED